MKTNSIINLLRLYWIENKKLLFFFSLVVFLFYMLLNYNLYYSIEFNQLEVDYNLTMLGMFFILFQSKNVLVSSNKYTYMILSAKTIDKWILSFLVFVFIALFLCLSLSVLGQIAGGYLAYWLKDDTNIVLNIFYNQQDLLLSVRFFFLVQGVVSFLFLTQVFSRKFSQMTASNKIILFFLFLALALSIKFTPSLVDNRDVISWIALAIGGCFWIANYFLIKNKQLK